MTDRAMTEAERYFFDVNGYVVRHNVISPQLVSVLNGHIDRQRLPPPQADLGSQRFVGLLDYGPEFADLLDHDDVLGVLRALVGPSPRIDHVYGIWMRQGQTGLGLHGGGTPFDPSQFYLWRDGEMINGLVGVMWGLSANAPGDGGFVCIPGSHKANLQVPHEVATYQAHTDWLCEVPLPPGSMLVFTEALVHGTQPWTASYERRAAVFKYAPGHLAWGPPMSWDDRIHGAKPGGDPVTAKTAARFTSRQRRLLIPPSMLGHPEV